MSFSGLPYNPDPWLDSPGALDYSYHEPLSTFQEGLHMTDPDLSNLPLRGTPHINSTSPETPRARPSRSDFNSSPGCPCTQPHSHHSPDYRMHQPRDSTYGTTARMQPNPTSYNPYYSHTPLEPAHPIIDHHQIHRRTSSASSTSSAIPFDRSFQHGGLRCKWEGCRYTGAFGRKFELRRHVETQHISPGGFECPYQGCSKGYNRKDNLEEHVRKAHPDMCLRYEV